MKTKAPFRKYQICTRCVMDTSDPWIKFDKKGICNHCKEFINVSVPKTNIKSKDKNALQVMFDNIKNKRKRESSHDVLIGISGGTDSSTAVVLAKEAGLKILAVHMDNGWDTPIAIKNINKLISFTDVDYESEVLNWNNFRELQRSFIESGLPDIEFPTDIAIPAVLNRVAIKYGIKTILSGGNVSNEGISPQSWMYSARDTRFAESVIRNSGYCVSSYKEIKFGFRDELAHRLFYKIRTLYPLNQFNYDKESAKYNLMQLFGWESPVGKHCESIYTRFCHLIYHPKRNKIDFRRARLSADICLKRIKREQALEILSSPPWEKIDVDYELEFVAYKLGYSMKQLKDLLSQPPFWYKDFPNREKLLCFSYDFYRFLTRRLKSNF